MWTRRFPPDEVIRSFLARQGREPFSYAEVGATRGELPRGYDVDHNRVRLGAGQAAFEAACAALARWRMFPGPWTRIEPADAPIREGSVVAVLMHLLGAWWLNSARIVYVVDERLPLRRFGFAYGTLPGHGERGEERFTVEWHEDDSVWYDLLAFSRPRHWLVRLGYPLARRFQRCFVIESQSAMLRAVRDVTGPDGTEVSS